MNDIVERLRNRVEMYDPQRAWKMQYEAADEIDRLRAALRELVTLWRDEPDDPLLEMSHAIERAREIDAAIAKAKEALDD